MLSQASLPQQKKMAMLYANNSGGFTIPRAGLAASFDAALGITSSGGFASAWADQSGNGRNLLQATGANQPIHLPFSGTKYGWLPGVSGNCFTTTDLAAFPTGDIEIIFDGTATDWTPATDQVLVCKDDGGAQRDMLLFLRGASARLEFWTSATGGSYAGRAAQATSALPLVDGSLGYIKVNRAAASGDVNFYTSTDRVNWAQLGTTVSTTAGAIHDGTAGITVGAIGDGTKTVAFNGKVNRATISGTIGGAAIIDFDPSRWTSGTTFTASTGETWTINSTGSKPAQIVDRSSLLFDGAAHYMKCAAFTLNQPCTRYLVFKQVTHTSGDRILDGDTYNSAAIIQGIAASPVISMYAGSAFACATNGPALGSVGVISSVSNGASSSLQLNSASASTGNPGANNPGGIVLGCSGAIADFSNVQAYEMLAYNVAHDAATSANIRRALMSKHGVA